MQDCELVPLCRNDAKWDRNEYILANIESLSRKVQKVANFRGGHFANGHIEKKDGRRAKPRERANDCHNWAKLELRCDSVPFGTEQTR